MDNLCRVCLETCSNKYPLFGKIIHVDVDIATMLSECCSTEIEKKDGFPNAVCVMCFKTIRIAYNLIQKFRKNQDILLQRHENVESEPDPECHEDLIEFIEVRVEEGDINDVREEAEKIPYENNSEIPNEDYQTYSEENFNDQDELVDSSESVDVYSTEQVIITYNNELENNKSSLEENEVDLTTIIDESSSKLVSKRKIPVLHECPICRKTNSKFQQFVNHILLHENTFFMCPRCQDGFNNVTYFVDHYKSLHLLQCTKCFKTMNTKGSYYTHLKTAHSTTLTRYLCKYENCGKSFNFKHSLRRHEVEHQEQPRYVCKDCNASFKGYDKYRYHTKVGHMGERPHLCTHCGKTFVQATHLKDHMWLHTGVKRYKCNDCDKAYTSSSQLKKHYKKNCQARLETVKQ